MTSSKSQPPVLKQFANLWTLTGQPSAAKPWSLEEKFRQAKKAGFDAMGGRVEPAAPALCQKYGLDYVLYLDIDAKSYRKELESAVAMRPARINIQMCNHDTPPAEAIKVWLKAEPVAKELELAIDLEVHRDTCTETPEKVDELARLYRKATGKPLRFCWDFSHLAVIKHIHPPYAPRLLLWPKLIQLSRQLHFRPFNGHHCEVPVTDGKGHETPEAKSYFEFLDELLALWFKGAKGGEVVYVCPEYGPTHGNGSGYALSMFPNVWKDAIHVREKTEALWKAHARKWAAK
jgi:hypothetical protein